MTSPALLATTITKISPQSRSNTDDFLAVEEPLEIELRYFNQDNWQKKTVSITMRTPGNDEELAAGFLFSEGILPAAPGIISSASQANHIQISLPGDMRPQLSSLQRNSYTNSSCGVCGKTGIKDLKGVSPFDKLRDDLVVDENILYRLPSLLRHQQDLFKNTGGLHAAALFHTNGQLILLREDVGRHNAADKLIGRAYLDHLLPLTNFILLFSGRTSFELVQKANMAGIRFIASIGAPSSLAVQLADESNISLVGFLNDNRFNIYTGSHRLAGKD